MATRTTACPSCGAALRPGAPWCTLCYADLRPPALAPLPPSAPIVAVPTAAYAEAVVDPLTAPLPRLLDPPDGTAVARATVAAEPVADGRTWPCGRCGDPNALERDTCATCGEGFLAAVRDAQRPMLVLPVVGDITRLDRRRRLLLAVLLVLVLLVPLAVLTLVQTGRSEVRGGQPPPVVTAPLPVPTTVPTPPTTAQPQPTDVLRASPSP